MPHFGSRYCFTTHLCELPGVVVVKELIHNPSGLLLLLFLQAVATAAPLVPLVLLVGLVPAQVARVLPVVPKKLGFVAKK